MLWSWQVSFFEGILAQKLRFHIFNHHFLREVSQESFVFTSSTFTLWGNTRTKASFSRLLPSLFEGILAGKLRFHIFHFHFVREYSHESFVFTSFTLTFWGNTRRKASFSHLPLSLCEGSLARKLRFHVFYPHFLREVSQESFVFTSSTFWGKSRTIASFSRLQLVFSEVLLESFCVTPSTRSAGRMARMRASFLRFERAVFSGCLADSSIVLTTATCSFRRNSGDLKRWKRKVSEDVMRKGMRR